MYSSNKEKLSVCLFGGSFNPPHNGHKMILEQLLLFPFTEVWLMPCYESPHKKIKLGKEHRINLLENFLKDFDRENVSLKLYEINKGKTTYTNETITFLKDKYPHIELFFALGIDSFLDLPNWEGFSYLKKSLTFILFQRDGDKVDLKKKEYEGIKVIPIKNSNVYISSTELRKNPTSLMLSKGVFSYINKYNLYKGISK